MQATVRSAWTGRPASSVSASRRISSRCTAVGTVPVRSTAVPRASTRTPSSAVSSRASRSLNRAIRYSFPPVSIALLRPVRPAGVGDGAVRSVRDGCPHRRVLPVPYAPFPPRPAGSGRAVPGQWGGVRLRTSDPERPGWRRVRHGRGFRYLDADGAPLGAEDRARAVALAIPPAWRDVWVCPWPTGHVQAVGTDAAGRRQYLYHEEFRRRREEAKHEHVREVARRLPRLRRAVERDLDLRGLCRDRVLACTVRLLDLGSFRIGGERYLKENASHGLTTCCASTLAARAGRCPSTTRRSRPPADADARGRAGVRGRPGAAPAARRR